MSVEFLGIIPLNIDFQRNMSIISFFFFFPFRSEKQLLGGHLSICQGKLAEPGVMDIIMTTNRPLRSYS